MDTCSKARGMKLLLAGFVIAALGLCLTSVESTAADWSTTELHVQYGSLDDPFGGLGNAGGTADTIIYTWQHASGWKYGDNFFFVDFLDGENGSFDAYGEWYSNFSIGKITGNEISMGPIMDLGIILGVNWGADPNVKAYLPGGRLSLDLPGFAFANLDITAYIVDNKGADPDAFDSPPPGPDAADPVPTDPKSAPDQDDGFMVDFNFATKQLEIGPTKWNIEGHVEYIQQGDNEFDSNESYWILGQPQLRLDISHLLGFEEPTVFAGIEYQFWINKLGGTEDENAVQALLVWRL